MKAQVLYGIDNLKYSEVDTPSIGQGEALIKVARCGICGSDIPRIYKTGAHNMPLIPGHEFSGRVVACDSRPDLVGKRVSVFPLIPCNKCAQCRQQHYEMCQNYDYLGSRSDGGFAEYVKVPVWNLVPVPDEVSDDDAAMLEPLCVAVHALRQIGLLNGGSWYGSDMEGSEVVELESTKFVAVCGLGTIGLLVALLLKDMGCQQLFCIGNKDVQRQMLLKMGCSPEQFIDVRYADPVESIMQRTGCRGVDFYFECIGRSENYEQAVNLTAPLGMIMLVGNPASNMELSRNAYWNILRSQLTLKGTWNSSFYGLDAHEDAARTHNTETVDMRGESVNTFTAQDDWQYALSRLYDWSLRKAAGEDVMLASDLITHRFSLEDMHKGLEIMYNKAEEYVKVMVD